MSSGANSSFWTGTHLSVTVTMRCSTNPEQRLSPPCRRNLLCSVQYKYSSLNIAVNFTTHLIQTVEILTGTITEKMSRNFSENVQFPGFTLLLWTMVNIRISEQWMPPIRATKSRKLFNNSSFTLTVADHTDSFRAFGQLHTLPRERELVFVLTFMRYIFFGLLSLEQSSLGFIFPITISAFKLLAYPVCFFFILARWN